MRRQGWALCLGMMVSSAAMAQPPAQDERFPPAPELPGGTVVSKPLGTKEAAPKTVTATPFAVQRASLQVTEAPKPTLGPAPMPIPPLPTTTTTLMTPPVAVAPATVPPITTVSVPVAPLASNCAPACPPTACPAPCAPTCAPACDPSPSHLPEWMHFRSTAKQSGHVPHPYYPPLYAWFPPGCVTNKPGPRGAGCATGHCAPAPCPTGNCAPAPLTHVPGLPALPVATAPMPVPTTVPYTVPLTAPATPVFTPPPVPSSTGFASQPSETDPLASFKKINDGLSFTPGGSPMAAPVKPVSRPK